MTRVSTAVPEPSTWIDGIPEHTPSTGTVLDDPNTGEPMREAHRSTEDQIDRAIAAAEYADREGVWRRTSVGERAAIVTAFLDRVESKAEAIATVDAQTSGTPVAVGTVVVSASVNIARKVVQIALQEALSGGDAREQRSSFIADRMPWGPAVVMGTSAQSTGNLVAMTTGGLLAGATVIAKPSPWAPSGADIVAREIASLSLPPGVFSLLVGGGEVGRRAVRDRRVRAVMSNGSLAASRRIAADASFDFTRTRLTVNAENPVFIGPGADLHRAAARIAGGAATLNGQWNECPRRVIVFGRDADELVEAMSFEMSLIPVGDSREPGSVVGPLPTRARVQRFEEALTRAEMDGAQIVAPAAVPDRGHFAAPSIVRVNGDRSLFGDQPTVGPVVLIATAADENEALRLAQMGAAGSYAYIFSEDDMWAKGITSRLRAGEVIVNGYLRTDEWPTDIRHDSFGSSGLGGRDERFGLNFFSGHRAVSVDEGSQYVWYE